MVTRIRRLLAALTHSGPGYDLPALPRRGDAVEAWLRAQRDQYDNGFTRDPQWEALDATLDAYRLHADTSTPLGQHACDGPHCDCAEVTA